jgi:hypothetical protein
LYLLQVLNYVLDPALCLEDDDLYEKSLLVEPRSSRMSSACGPSAAAAAAAAVAKMDAQA